MTALKQNAALRLIALLAVLLVLSPNAVPLAIPEAFQRAALAERNGDAAAAASALNEAAQRLPNDGAVAYRSGMADLAAQRFNSAALRLQRAAELTGWTPALHLALGDALAGSGDRAGALAQWEAALQAAPTDDALLTRLAFTYEAEGDYERAIAAYAQRFQNGVTDPAMLYRLALLTAVTKPEDAVARLTVVTNVPSEYAPRAQALQRAIEAGLSEGDPAYTFGRVGYELIQFQDWALAEHALTQAVTLNPEYADAFAYLGLAQDAQNKDGEAAYQRAVDISADSPLAQYLFGLHYRKQGESAKALPYLQAAQQLDPQNPAIVAEIGGAYAAQGDFISAESWFNKSVELAPRDPQFWLLLARFYIDNEFKIAELGLPAARMAVGLDPNSALAADALGYALIISGDFVNGEKNLQRAVTLDPNLASAYYHFGLYYAIRNKGEEARAALNHALALDPQGNYGNLALKALALVPESP
ncbi:MAG: tetratricopeptide repeat protein [Anaerolineales bacterium]